MNPLTLLLVRHATTDRGSTHLLGRLRGVQLSPQGIQQATELAKALSWTPIAAFYTSPQQRAHHTASIIARPHVGDVQVLQDLDEVDFGEWTGRAFKDLARSIAWQQYNTARTQSGIPGGESVAAFHQRTARALQQIRRTHPTGLVAVVSHAEVLRAWVLHAQGLTLDDWLQVRIDPATVSVLEATPDGWDASLVNCSATELASAVPIIRAATKDAF